MKLTILSLALISASAISAQNLGDEPSCAIPCLQTAISLAGCAASDQGCQCGTGQAAIQTAVTPCLLQNCNQADLLKAASVGLALCSVYSASLTAVTVSTTAVSTTAVPASTVSSTSAVSSSVVSTTSKSSVVVTTPAPTTTKTNGTVTSKTSSLVQVTTNAAPAVMAGFGGMLGVAVGVFAAL